MDLERTCPACKTRYPARARSCPGCGAEYRSVRKDVEPEHPDVEVEIARAGVKRGVLGGACLLAAAAALFAWGPVDLYFRYIAVVCLAGAGVYAMVNGFVTGNLDGTMPPRERRGRRL